jgi:periplasmic protein CpxP/Spy
MFRKKAITDASLVVGLMLGAAFLPLAAAAQTTGSVPQRHAQNTYRRRTLDDHVKSFAKALHLDEAQQAGVKAILERQQVEARRIQFDQSLSGADRISRFRALQQETVLRIRAILNDEQKQKYDPLNHGTQMNPSDPSVEDWLKSTHHN